MREGPSDTRVKIAWNPCPFEPAVRAVGTISVVRLCSEVLGAPPILVCPSTEPLRDRCDEGLGISVLAGSGCSSSSAATSSASKPGSLASNLKISSWISGRTAFEGPRRRCERRLRYGPAHWIAASRIRNGDTGWPQRHGTVCGPHPARHRQRDLTADGGVPLMREPGSRRGRLAALGRTQAAGKSAGNLTFASRQERRPCRFHPPGRQRAAPRFGGAYYPVGVS